MSNPTGSASMYEDTLGERLAKALRRAGISNTQMADELGVRDTTVRNYIAGRTVPTRAVLRTWAIVCNIDFGWLETGILDLTEGAETSGDVQGRQSGWTSRRGLVERICASVDRSHDPFRSMATAG